MLRRPCVRVSSYDQAFILFKLLISIMLAWSVSVHSKEVYTGQVERIADGDTVWVRADAGGRPRKLRLEGIDAPEICQPGGETSRTFLLKLALHQRVSVMVNHQDDYGRGLARVHLKGEDLGARMVRSGHAWSYRWRRSPGPYAAEEKLARQARLGLFANDAAEVPRDFRKRHGSCYPAFKAK